MARNDQKTKGDGKSTFELFTLLFEQLRGLRKEMERRRSKDRASVLLTDSYVTLQQIGERFAVVSRDFDSRPVARDLEDEEDYEPQAEQRAMADLFPGTLHADEESLDKEMLKRVVDFRASYQSIHDVRLRLYREFLDYLLAGCTQLSEVTAKLLAIGRRVRPESMERFGISQVAVSRKVDKRRATISAREIRCVEKPLIKSGAKGYQVLGGNKSISHREKCRKAQKGNTNRKDGERRKRSHD